MSARTRQRAVVVTFALPDEGSAFVRRLKGLTRKRGHLAPVCGELGEWTVTVAFTGVGAGEDCLRRVDDVLREAAPEALISSGFAGALRAGLAVGDLVVGENFSEPGLAGLVMGERVHRGALTTQAQLAETPAAKAALAAATGAMAVDMETEWIAAACARAGVPMLSLRVISDAADQGFPAPGDVLFDVVRQRPRYVRLPWWLATHPRRIGGFVGFVRGLGPARGRLAGALDGVIAGLGGFLGD